MKIKANQDFLHDVKRYRKGRSYDVPGELGSYFVASGWADSPEVTASGKPPAETDLDVNDSAMGQNSEVK